jgi:microsomal prostaglandin-E synthase 1
MDLWHSPPFALYALFATGLCLLLLIIDGAGGGARAGSKTTPNLEDASTTAKGAKIVESDPEAVARVMRAHRNALANIVPFLFVMFLYVAVGATATWVLALCGVFAAARVLHAIVYIKGIQPWRTIFFTIGQICTIVAAVQVVRAAFAFV